MTPVTKLPVECAGKKTRSLKADKGVCAVNQWEACGRVHDDKAEGDSNNDMEL